MTDREKLIELLNVEIYPHEAKSPAEVVADYLLDNGVTVQRWIPVSERLPEESGWYLGYTIRGTCSVFHYSAQHRAFNAFDDISNDCEILCSHWMSLPLPPKEVE